MIYGLPSLLQLEECRRQAPWMEVALKELGVREEGGLDDNNPRILEYIASYPYLATVPHMVKDPSDPSGKRKMESGYMAGDVDETHIGARVL